MLKCIHVKYSGSMFKCIGNKFYFLQNVERHKYFPFQLANPNHNSGLFFMGCGVLLCDQTGMTPVIPDIRFTYLTFQLIRPLVLVCAAKGCGQQEISPSLCLRGRRRFCMEPVPGHWTLGLLE